MVFFLLLRYFLVNLKSEKNTSFSSSYHLDGDYFLFFFPPNYWHRWNFIFTPIFNSKNLSFNWICHSFYLNFICSKLRFLFFNSFLSLRRDWWNSSVFYSGKNAKIYWHPHWSSGNFNWIFNLPIFPLTAFPKILSQKKL